MLQTVQVDAAVVQVAQFTSVQLATQEPFVKVKFAAQAVHVPTAAAHVVQCKTVQAAQVPLTLEKPEAQVVQVAAAEQAVQLLSVQVNAQALLATWYPDAQAVHIPTPPAQVVQCVSVQAVQVPLTLEKPEAQVVQTAALEQAVQLLSVQVTVFNVQALLATMYPDTQAVHVPTAAAQVVQCVSVQAVQVLLTST